MVLFIGLSWVYDDDGGVSRRVVVYVKVEFGFVVWFVYCDKV